MPPPMTSSRSGMPSTSSAPVESTIRVVVGQERQRRRLRARGDDAVLEADDGVADLRSCSAPVNSPSPRTTCDLALLGERLEAAGELADDAVLERADAVEVDLRLAEA